MISTLEITLVVARVWRASLKSSYTKLNVRATLRQSLRLSYKYHYRDFFNDFLTKDYASASRVVGLA
jgi:hypothetical protein